MVEISATKKMNLDKLVEAIILQAEIPDLKTDFESKAIDSIRIKIVRKRTCCNNYCNHWNFKKR